MKKHNIALVYGGMGLEHEVSVQGAEYAFEQLDKIIFKVVPVFINKNGDWLSSKDEMSSPLALATGTFPSFKVLPTAKDGIGGFLFEDGGFTEIDAAFPLLHGDFGEDGIPTGALESAKIPCIGCDTVSGALCYDKIYTKIIAESLGIPTARWVSAEKLSAADAKAKAEKSLSYPMFIKPARLGSSFGASPVKDCSEFISAYEKAEKIGKGRVIIEECAKIESELECGYFGSNKRELFSYLGEIHCESGFYDYDTKYDNPDRSYISERCPLDVFYGGIIREYSKKLKDTIGINGISRFDFFLTKDKHILFNEINTMPGFTKTSLYPRILEFSGIKVKEGLTELLLEKVSHL